MFCQVSFEKEKMIFHHPKGISTITIFSCLPMYGLFETLYTRGFHVTFYIHIEVFIDDLAAAHHETLTMQLMQS